MSFAQGSQQGISLRQHLLVAGECPKIGTIGLGEGQIEVAAAQVGRTEYQIDVGRCEERDHELANQFRRLPLDAVHHNLLARRRAIGRVLTLSLRQCSDDYVQPDPIAGAFDQGCDTGKCAARCVSRRIPVEELAIGTGAEGARRGQQIHCFQQIALALTVVATEDRVAGRKVQSQAPVVSKAGQMQLL